MTTTDQRQALRLPAPPPMRPKDGGALLLALPALGGLGSVGLVASSGLAGSGAMRTRSLVAAGLFLVVTLAFVVLQVERQRRQRRDLSGMSREDHLVHLARAREAVRVAARAQRERALRRHPSPVLLLTDPLPAPRATLDVRIGSATGPFVLQLEVPEPVAGQPPDAVAQRALDRFVATHAQLSGLPVEIDLRTTPEIVLLGPAEERRATARALVCSAVRGREARLLRIAALLDPEATAGHDEAAIAWEWLKWLPHHGSPTETDGVGAARLLLRAEAELDAVRTPGAHLLVLDERAPAPAGSGRSTARPDTTLVRLGSATAPQDTTPGGTALVLGSPARVLRDGADVTPEDLAVDACDMATASAFARRLTAATTAEGPRDALALLRRGPREPLRVPIGTDPAGGAVHLDLREPAAGGHGPHGLLIGATGSGKSELLRTLVTGLAVRHAPEEVTFLLVDFKGGATFAGLAELPHTSGLITNLVDDLALVDRMQDALAGELTRRQEVLRAAGRSSARELGDELPTLVVVVDEFTELLAARPDLAELFAGIGRVGRSLGVHLLLASQRLDEGRLRGLESHLGYRIALRTFSAAESRAVIGVPDAHQLPASPGGGYLRTGPEEPVRFQGLLVSASGRTRVPGGQVLPFTAAPVRDPGALLVETPPLLDRVVTSARQRAGAGRSARALWTPPLSDPVDLTALLAAVDRPGPGRLPVGMVDRPREQRHAPFLLDLRGTAGHVAVVGAPRTGRSSLLATLVHGLVATADPGQVRFAVVDLGGALAGLDRLSEVVSHVGRGQAAELRALVAELAEEVARRRAGRTPADPEVHVVVDGWSTLRDQWPDVEHDLVTLAQESLASGVHLLVSATRWGDLRPSLRDVVGTKLELRLGDPMESLHGRRLAEAVPRGPGHGLTPDGHHFLAAVTRPAGASSVSAGRRS
ncbi:FtsK/SpoIIIE domain-containing protein [Nocardioides sp.]|uniref:FtsK/SpoIIIE domain-containing protein n=1 Tax=Nocardioides sp. TaxID=35761 RepID=UPI002BD56EBF|nr:FtsK/SpoIIIE domain-containing protein [Nocardioides sp.]HSX68334.1 FtsK/SpoIIIE domain-containing protein [Nocardioides sp.]